MGKSGPPPPLLTTAPSLLSRSTHEVILTVRVIAQFNLNGGLNLILSECLNVGRSCIFLTATLKYYFLLEILRMFHNAYTFVCMYIEYGSRGDLKEICLEKKNRIIQVF